MLKPLSQSKLLLDCITSLFLRVSDNPRFVDKQGFWTSKAFRQPRCSGSQGFRTTKVFGQRQFSDLLTRHSPQGGVLEQPHPPPPQLPDGAQRQNLCLTRSISSSSSSDDDDDDVL
eukprot:jgi/Botrbrau1/13059/Bobra.0187s0021.1